MKWFRFSVIAEFWKKKCNHVGLIIITLTCPERAKRWPEIGETIHKAVRALVKRRVVGGTVDELGTAEVSEVPKIKVWNRGQREIDQPAARRCLKVRKGEVTDSTSRTCQWRELIYVQLGHVHWSFRWVCCWVSQDTNSHASVHIICVVRKMPLNLKTTYI